MTAWVLIDELRDRRLADEAPVIEAHVYEEALERQGMTTGLASGGPGKPSKVWAVGVVPVPMDRFWEVLTTASSFERPSGTLEVSQVIGGDLRHGRTIVQRLDVPALDDRCWVAVQRSNDALYEDSGHLLRELRWQSVDTPLPIEQADACAGAVRVPWSQGAWLLTPVGTERTLVEYFAWSDPGGMIPARAAARFSGDTVEKLVDALTRAALAKDSAHAP